MKTTIELQAGEEIGLHELHEAIEPWLNSNEDLSVRITPFINIDSDTIEIVIIRAKKKD